MIKTSRGRTPGWARGSIWINPLSTTQYLQLSPPNESIVKDNTTSHSNDSTQPPDDVFEMEFSDPMVDTSKVLGATVIHNSIEVHLVILIKKRL